MCILFAAMVCASVHAQETSGSCGANATWAYDASKATLTISGTGAMYDYDGEAPWSAYVESVKTVEIEEGITSVGNNAFNGCTALKSVTFPPDGFIRIGDYALSGCTSFKNLNMPRSMTTIGDGAFSGSAVRGATIYGGVKKIGNYAFESCASLEGVGIYEGVEEIGKCAFDGCGLTSVALPSTVTTIGDGAFMSCEALEEVYIGAGVTTIGDAAFQGCTALTSIGIGGATAPVLGDAVFTGHVGETPLAITAFYVPSTTPYSGGWGGYAASKFKTSYEAAWENSSDPADGSGTWSFNVTTGTLTVNGTGILDVSPWMGMSCINPEIYTEETPGYWYKVKSFVVGEGITHIRTMGVGMQINCASVTLPSTLKYVGYSCLEECAFTSIVLPEGLETIDDYTFYDSKLTSLTIPSTVTYIGSSAFLANEDLRAITCLPTTPPDLGPYEPCFGDGSTITAIYVPAESVDAYKNWTWDGSISNPHWNGWSTYADKIVAQGDAPATTTTFTYTASEKVTAFDDITYFTGATGVASHDFADGAGTVVFNGTVTAIATNAVASNTSLTGVVIPDGVTTVGIGAFSYCSNLASVTLPDGLQTLDQGSFAYTKISTVTIPSTVESINAAAFMGCASLTGIDIPNSVTSLGNNIFLGCSKLEYAHLGSGITAISRKLFDNCTRLASIVIPDGVTVIGAEAFMGCSGLETVIIGSGVAEIEDGSTDGFDEAFQGCTAVTDVYCYADAAVITWAKNSNTTIFKSSKSTRFHVTDAAAWTAKFPDANVTFAGDLVATRPATNAVTDGDGTAYWSTYYNSTQDVVADANTEVYQVSLSGTSLTLTKVADRIVNAGQGVVMKSTAANIVLLTAATQSATSYAANSLTGTDTQLTNPGNAYVLGNGDSGVGFYRLSDTGTIGAHKAYLTYDGATARDFLGFDAETTGIHAVQGSRSVIDGYYNLSGQHVAQPGKGLYIVNGKKFVIK